MIGIYLRSPSPAAADKFYRNKININQLDSTSLTHLAHGALVGLQLQHEVLVIVEPRLYGLQLLLAETVEREEVILGLQQPAEDLLQHVGPGGEVDHLVPGQPPDRRHTGGETELRVRLATI